VAQKQRLSRKRRDKKQKVWEYMRRNRIFRVEDLMLVQELSWRFLKPLLWHLNEAGYLKLLEAPKDHEKRLYKMVKNTGLKSPAVINGVVYDYNTKERITVTQEQPRSPTRTKLLEAMTHTLMSKQEIYTKAEVNMSGSSKKHMAEFTFKGVITKKMPVTRRNGHILYTINPEKRDELLSPKKGS